MIRNTENHGSAFRQRVVICIWDDIVRGICKPFALVQFSAVVIGPQENGLKPHYSGRNLIQLHQQIFKENCAVIFETTHIISQHFLQRSGYRKIFDFRERQVKKIGGMVLIKYKDMACRVANAKITEML